MNDIYCGWTMNAFDYCFNRTFEIEKGPADGYSKGDQSDPETNCGITIDKFKEALQRGIITGVADLKDLTFEQKKTIYRVMIWMEMRLGEIEDVDIAAEIFDTATNMGNSAAAGIAQKACNYLGEYLREDGVMGLATLGALNKWAAKDKRALFISLNGFQFIRYVAIISKKNQKKKFSRGWTKRIQDYRG